MTRNFSQNISRVSRLPPAFYICSEDFKPLGIRAPLFGAVCFALVYAIPGKTIRLIKDFSTNIFSTRNFLYFVPGDNCKIVFHVVKICLTMGSAFSVPLEGDQSLYPHLFFTQLMVSFVWLPVLCRFRRDTILFHDGSYTMCQETTIRLRQRWRKCQLATGQSDDYIDNVSNFINVTRPFACTLRVFHRTIYAKISGARCSLSSEP